MDIPIRYCLLCEKSKLDYNKEDNYFYCKCTKYREKYYSGALVWASKPDHIFINIDENNALVLYKSNSLIGYFVSGHSKFSFNDKEMRIKQNYNLIEYSSAGMYDIINLVLYYIKGNNYLG